MTFTEILSRVVDHEGGFTENPKDPGNWTGGKVGQGELKGSKYGISAASYPGLNIKKLTWDNAVEIYWVWYRECQLYSLRKPMQYQMFDAAFNHGLRRANKLLQKSVGAKQDGIVGTQTRAKVSATDLDDLVLVFLSNRLEFFTNLEHFDEFGRGWARRVALNMKYAAEDN